MPIRVDAYIAQGVASGVLLDGVHLHDALEGPTELPLHQVSWQAVEGGPPAPTDDLTLAMDDVLVAVGDDDPPVPVHASWHALRLDVGPYVVEGEMPTLPGYDPGRALTRPSGEFVLLRDVRIARRAVPGPSVPIGRQAYVNRYGVERVEADIQLGFYFPGASLGTTPPAG